MSGPAIMGHLRRVGGAYLPDSTSSGRNHSAVGRSKGSEHESSVVSVYTQGYIDILLMQMTESITDDGLAHQSFIHPAEVIHMGQVFLLDPNRSKVFLKSYVPLLRQMCDNGYFSHPRFTRGQEVYDRTNEANQVLTELEKAMIN